MVVRAVEQGGDDVDKMVAGLEGYSFDSVKGKLTVRGADHAVLQPMFQAKLTGTGTAAKAELVKALAPDEVAPPAAAMKG
jgi:branched-chain amino acid transport system substrate-binding protein